MATFRFVCVYENPETSESAGSYTTLEEALKHPPKPAAEIMCNGTTLAKAFQGHNYTGSWHLTPEGQGWAEFPEGDRPTLVDGCWVSKG
jgi:hypothetical protein